jgi:hypothetical protein
MRGVGFTMKGARFRSRSVGFIMKGARFRRIRGF